MNSLKRKASDVVDLTDSPNEKPKASVDSKNNNASPLDLSMVSYNVWFGPPHPAKRMEALSEAILNTPGPLPRFIGMQEVTPQLSSFLFPLLEQVGYQVMAQEGVAYGCALALQVDQVLDSGFVPFEQGIMGRGILWASAKVQDCNVLFTTTHLESFVPNYMGTTYTGAKEREMQLAELKKFCEEFPNVNLAVISGDLNWDDERKRATGLDKPMLDLLNNEWTDAWRQHRPTDEGYTYDSKKSPMLRKGGIRRRFDRILIRGVSTKFEVTDTELIGKNSISGIQWNKETKAGIQKMPVLPSDHFGLRVTLQVTTNKK